MSKTKITITVGEKVVSVEIDSDDNVRIDDVKTEAASGSNGKKYEITDIQHPVYSWLRRIRALRDIPRYGVKKGDLGGYVNGEKNLSQEGECWIGENARVFENAQVFGNAWIGENAWVYGNALVYENAQVYGDALVRGNSQVGGYAWVYGNSSIHCGKHF